MGKNIAWRICRKQFQTPDDLSHQVHKGHNGLQRCFVVLRDRGARGVKEGGVLTDSLRVRDYRDD